MASSAVSTQVNVMTHATYARKTRGAKIVVVDTYLTDTARQADLFLCVNPGTDGALACAVMHVLFRDGHADRAYLEKYTDCPQELEAHLQSRSPEWAEAICGVPVAQIEEFAKLLADNKKHFLRIGYGMGRQRNGAHNIHAVLSIAAVSGAWQYEGGGAFHNNGAIEGWDYADPKVRWLDQSRIGDILLGNAKDLRGGPPVHGLFIQNTNPMMVAPELAKVHKGFAREDLFTCVHEQFMTDTAKMADIGMDASASDAAVGALCARAAVRGAGMNVRINAKDLQDTAARQAYLDRAASLEAEAADQEAKILASIESKM